MTISREAQTAFIRRVQAQGVAFVCEARDRAVGHAEQACENCDCITDAPPKSDQPQIDVREYVKNL